ncbi:hypothetical protein CYY_010100 [Polysphondylium violaceum]|uniref:TLDc domain-containing protein n=1 Tax=Polysphondylium violaceum TaxID=133409 RepID=A0A8J4PKC0_9MYCE|nr:hypothetical protein CYY_010100 [Polysphondylium violaceum]
MYSSNNNTPDIVESCQRKNIEESIEGVQSLFLGYFESMQQQIKALEKRKEILIDVTKVIDVSVIPDPITLNIGGFKYQTTKATLTKIPNSFFDLMLSGEINIKPMTNEPNTYFIDRDGTHFNYILNYLRDEGDIQIPEDIRHCVRKEMEFYRINNHFKLDDTATIIDKLNSLKLKLDETEQELVLAKEESIKTRKEVDFLILSESSLILRSNQFKIISDWIDKKLTNFQLLYRASENNSFNTRTFHSKCDGKGATITVIVTTDGCIFGGYNSHSWNSNGYFYGDNRCFIFTLVNKHGIPPTKYLPKENNTNYVSSGSNPMFGYQNGNTDIRIGEKDSYQMFPSTYNDTTGKCYTTLTPFSVFTIKYLEIYKCS